MLAITAALRKNPAEEARAKRCWLYRKDRHPSERQAGTIMRKSQRATRAANSVWECVKPGATPRTSHGEAAAPSKASRLNPRKNRLMTKLSPCQSSSDDRLASSAAKKVFCDDCAPAETRLVTR